MKSQIEKIKNERRMLSLALANILDRAVPWEDMKDKEFYVVPNRLIKDAMRVYRKIWRKP